MDKDAEGGGLSACVSQRPPWRKYENQRSAGQASTLKVYKTATVQIYKDFEERERDRESESIVKEEKLNGASTLDTTATTQKMIPFHAVKFDPQDVCALV